MKERNLRVLMPTTSFIRHKSDFFNVYIYRFAKALVENGIEVVVLAPDDKETKLQEVIDGIRIVRFQYFLKRYQCLAYGASGIPHNIASSHLAKIQIPFFLLAFLRKILELAPSCDLIHAQWLPPAFLSLFARFVFKKPVILTEHNTNLRHYPKILTRFVMSRVNTVTTAHPEIADLIRSLGRSDVWEIPNILDAAFFQKTRDKEVIRKEIGIRDEKVVAFVARLEDWKGPLEFIRAVPHVIRKRQDVKFLIVGDGNLMTQVRSLVNELPVSDFVKVLGPRKDVNDLLSISHIFTALSKIENIWSTTIIEAMIIGVPCVLTDVGYTGKVLTHNENCYLLGADGALEERLSQAILFLLENEGACRRISRNAKLFLKEKGFQKEKILGKFMEIYQAMPGIEVSVSQVAGVKA